MEAYMGITAISPVGQVTPTADIQLNPKERGERSALVQAVQTLNQAQSFGPNSEVTFSLDRTTHKPVLQIVDRQTNEVISQLPPEHVLRMALKLSRAG